MFTLRQVFKHLHEKIRIQDIAGFLHLDANYLSELFKQCESITLTDFILKEKVKLTKKSHLGKVFKKYTEMTLRQYRQKYGQNFYTHS